MMTSCVFVFRFTANDPCNWRCSMLYKDHYHCNEPHCNQLFQSKDACVREHAMAGACVVTSHNADTMTEHVRARGDVLQVSRATRPIETRRARKKYLTRCDITYVLKM